MALNIFEGARRIAKLVAVVWVVGISSFILMQGAPFITGIYYISTSDRRVGPSDPPCEYLNHFRQEEITVKTKKGTEAYITLCFPPEIKEFLVTIPSGDKYVVTSPVVATEQEVRSYVQSEEVSGDTLEAEFNRYKKEHSVASLSAAVKKQEKWRDDPIVLSWEGRAFAEHLKNTLVLSQADEEWIHGQWWAKWWEQIRQGLLVIVAGVVLLWGLTWSIGWIVRGFLGIPRGQDHKTA